MTRLLTEEFAPDQLVTPPCPHFEDCGSCQLQHVEPVVYRSWKEQKVRELIAANGLTPKEWKPSVFIGQGTRRRVTISVQRNGDVYVVGFNKYHAHELAAISSCLLLTPRLNDVLKKIPDGIKGIVPRGGSIDLSIQETDNGHLDATLIGVVEQGAKQTGQIARLADLCDFARVSLKKDVFSKTEIQISLTPMKKTNGVLSVDVPPNAFLQPSMDGEMALCTAVMGALDGRKFGKKDKVADLFSGCGTFAGEILKKYSVHACEGDWEMAACLIDAAKGHARFSAECRDLFKEPVSARELREYKAVVFDPPRAGAKEQCQKLAKTDIPVIVGVSCHPATFARDARILCEGGYQLASLQIIDQFTWSTHLELVGVFEK